MRKSDLKRMFFESVRQNKYADFVYKDLEGFIDVQEPEDNPNEGFHKKRAIEHLICAMLHTEDPELLDRLRVMVHDVYRSYLAPMVGEFKSIDKAVAKLREQAAAKAETKKNLRMRQWQADERARQQQLDKQAKG